MGLKTTRNEVEEDVIHMLALGHDFGNLDGGFAEYGVIGT